MEYRYQNFHLIKYIRPLQWSYHHGWLAPLSWQTVLYFIPIAQWVCAGTKRIKKFLDSFFFKNEENFINDLDHQILTVKNLDTCYEDNRARILWTFIGDFQNNKKLVCISACSYNGYKFAGVQYGTQCFCGNDQPNSSLLRPGQCTTSCPGNSNENCGETWRMNVYETTGKSDCCNCFVIDTKDKCCKLESEILKEAKNAQKWHFGSQNYHFWGFFKVSSLVPNFIFQPAATYLWLNVNIKTRDAVFLTTFFVIVMILLLCTTI